MCIKFVQYTVPIPIHKHTTHTKLAHKISENKRAKIKNNKTFSFKFNTILITMPTLVRVGRN